MKQTPSQEIAPYLLSENWTPPKNPPHQGIITFSRQAGLEELLIEQKLQTYLNQIQPQPNPPWELHDKTLVETIIQQHHLTPEIADYLPERKTPPVLHAVEELLGLHPSAWSLFEKTNQTILQLAQRGNVILVGRGSQILTRGLKNSLHIRLIGSLEQRIHYFQKQNNLSQQQAKQQQEKENRERKDYLQQYFQQNIDNPLLYDLIINTDRLSPSHIVQTIAHLLLARTPSL